jgi:hypothetical protein
VYRFLVLALALSLSSCSAQKIHPGSPNAFDSASYDALIATHSVIESTKTDLANNVFPVSIAGNVKTALNDLVAAYNAADTAYQTYHASALAGAATVAQQTALQNALTNMSTKTTTLSTTKGTS